MSMIWDYEETAWQAGYQAVCGVDEAGYGPWAGPVCAAAVILPPHIEIEGLNDSKKLSERKREALFSVIQGNALAWAVYMVDEQTIDDTNILQAAHCAMRQAVHLLPQPADFAYVDGNRSPALPLPHECVVAGDAKIPSVAAASILAKVSRDQLMKRLAVTYPEYGFDTHKGYGTRKHIEALLTYGPCPFHRRTFLRKFYSRYPDAPRERVQPDACHA